MQLLELMIEWLGANQGILITVGSLLVIAAIYCNVTRKAGKSAFRDTWHSSGKLFIAETRVPNEKEILAEADALIEADARVGSIDFQEPEMVTSGSLTKPLNDRRFSLAVLLFDTLSDNQDDKILASGITSEIIAHVTTIPM